MLLIVVRHGESENNVLSESIRSEHGYGTERTQQEYDSRKSPDPHLSEQGRRQARRVAEYLRSVYINPENGANAVFGSTVRRIEEVRVASSPMQRALQTSKPIAEAFSCGVEVLRDSHENKGCWSGSTGPARGLSAKEIEDAYPFASAWDKEDDDGWWACRPKETPSESAARAIRLASMLRGMALQATKRTAYILVSHGNFMSMLVQALLDLSPATPPLREKMFKHQNTALSIFMLPGDIEDATRRNNGAPVQCLALNVCSHLDPNTSRFFDDQDEKLETVACGEQGVAWTGFDE